MNARLICVLTLLSLGFPFKAAADVKAGEKLFNSYCASCHGFKADGKGPAQLNTTRKPTDLTMLAAGNSGKFPYDRVKKAIDGRVDEGNIRSHYAGDMPVWGDVFREQKGHSVTGQIHGDAVAKKNISNLTEYLVSLQRDEIDAALEARQAAESEAEEPKQE